jgi:N-acetylglucosaminyl-diphospho-decaprenol L-rhamnosyltransferase
MYSNTETVPNHGGLLPVFPISHMLAGVLRTRRKCPAAIIRLMAAGSAIVVAYNSASSIEQCLRALRNENGWEHIVIDNASCDDTAVRARRADPQARLVRNSENLGFAAAVNQGARLATGKILLILNPDTTARPGGLAALATALESDAVGAAGGALLRENGEVDRGFTVRRFPTPLFMATEILLLNRFWPSNPLNRAYRCLDMDYSKRQEVEQPAGACLAVKREAWESVGGFDETFFPIWFEDADFCHRLRTQGWKILYCPEAVFAHSGGHSVSQLPLRDRQLLWYGNLLRYFRKHSSRAAVAGLRACIALGMALRSLAALVGAGPEDVKLPEALRAYAAVVRRCVLAGPGSRGFEKQ